MLIFGYALLITLVLLVSFIFLWSIYEKYSLMSIFDVWDVYFRDQFSAISEMDKTKLEIAKRSQHLFNESRRIYDYRRNRSSRPRFL